MKKKKELLKSPERAWNDVSGEYDAILLVPDGTKHDSGFMHIAVIGVKYRSAEGEEEFEICGYPDDISCIFPLREFGPGYVYACVRMDCYYPQGVLRYHGDGTFTVSAALSSQEITFHPRVQGPEVHVRKSG